MAGSYEKINYALRPAKNIERKMLSDAFKRLSEFGKIDNYRYIGLGSTFFTDFSLFHRTLGITNNISIERDLAKKERFEFNRPFKCIQIEYGESNDVLPQLDWGVKSIVWLDYDSTLNQSVLTDIDVAFTNAIPGSTILFSVNAHPGTMGERLNVLIES